MLVFASGCDAPSRSEFDESIGKLDQRMSNLAQKQVSAETELNYESRLQSHKLSWVEERQDNTEDVLSAMGDGFNILTESIEEVHEDARRIEGRQRSLEHKFKKQASRTLSDFGSETVERVFKGPMVDLRSGETDFELEIILRTPLVLRLGQPGQMVQYLVEEVGRRLYVVEGKVAYCFDILDYPNLETFEDRVTLANCEAPYQVGRLLEAD